MKGKIYGMVLCGLLLGTTVNAGSIPLAPGSVAYCSLMADSAKYAVEGRDQGVPMGLLMLMAKNYRGHKVPPVMRTDLVKIVRRVYNQNLSKADAVAMSQRGCEADEESGKH